MIPYAQGIRSAQEGQASVLVLIGGRVCNPRQQHVIIYLPNCRRERTPR